MSTNQSSWPDTEQMLRHQYGISVDAQQILGVVEGLQSDNQPQQNRGTVPACSKHHMACQTARDTHQGVSNS